MTKGGVARYAAREDALCDGAIFGGHFAPQDHEQSLEAADRHAGG